MSSMYITREGFNVAECNSSENIHSFSWSKYYAITNIPILNLQALQFEDVIKLDKLHISVQIYMGPEHGMDL